MSDPAKVRLVRCPKCENLLPELDGYSVYQCGGCGALLRAQIRNLQMDSLSQKSDEERVQVVEENIHSKPDNFIFPVEKRIFKEGPDNEIRSSDASSRNEEKKNEKLKAEKWVANDDIKRNETLHGYAHAEMEREYRDLRPSNGAITGSLRSESFGDWRGIDGCEGNRKQNFQASRYSSSIYQDGPSNYPLRPSYGFKEQINNRNGADEVSKVECLEQDRVALLKKLDELKEQISRSCDINDKPKQKVPLELRQEVTCRNKHPYAGQYNETSPYIGQHEMGMHRYYDPSSSHMLRTSHQEPNLYFPRHYMHNKIDPYQQPYPNDTNLNHPHCSCVHCYNHPSRVNHMLPHEPYDPMLHQHENQRSFGLLDYNSKAMNSIPLGTRKPHSHPRCPNDLNFDMYGYGSCCPPKVVMATGKRHCRPIAGAAPLVSCYNCFQVLELPNILSPTKRNHVKVKCGACLTVILFAIVDNKLVSASVDMNMTPNMAVKNSNLAVEGNDLHTHVRANKADTSFSSDDYENTGYIFHLLDSEKQGFGSSKPENTRGFHSASSCSSELEISPDSMNPQEEGPNLVELEGGIILSPPLAGSPLQDYFDYSSKYVSDKGNPSGRSDIELAELKKVISRQNSVKDAPLATEMEVSFIEDINTGTSFESEETSKYEDQLGGNKGAQSFFAGFIKKSFKNHSKSNNIVEQSSTTVMINGHPITEKLLKKAEKMAGPVHPGQYWYDSRAGFWGVMSGPCLGIIPPFIEEFNSSMPENCAGGNTGVFVNGRELHQKDLNLLSSRGLPSTGNRSYIIEISGRVLDEDTGEELPSLGKLAPTVEKAKHGFGMKVPRIAA